MKKIGVVFLLFISSIWSKEITLIPECHVGAHMSTHESDFGVGGVLGGGVYLGKRHYVGGDAAFVRYINTWEPAQATETNTLSSMQFHYMIAPLVIRSNLRGELGFSLMYGCDSQKEYYGTWGIPARLSAGGKRVHWYVQGVINSAVVLDVISIESDFMPYLANVSTGVQVLFGR